MQLRSKMGTSYMADWTGFTSILVAFFIIAASPGPATLAISTVSAAFGRKSGMVFGTGLAVGLAFWGIVAATGLGAILQASTHLLIALKIAGGVYLLWLAYRSARSAMHSTSGKQGLDGNVQTENARLFTKGLILNLSNPKAVVAWMAALSVGLGGDNDFASVVVVTLGCAIVGQLIYMAYAAAFSLSVVMDAYITFRRWIDGLVATLFTVAGFALIRSAFTRS
ncbi:MAG: LysE family translocator [Pseudomonadota bacterium]